VDRGSDLRHAGDVLHRDRLLDPDEPERVESTGGGEGFDA